MEKTLINYASGGLGNILLPMASCKAFAKKTNRKFIACWEPTFACMATYSDLFEDTAEVIIKNDLVTLDNVKIYGSSSDINYDGHLFNNTSLSSISNKYLPIPVNHLHIRANDDENNLIVYHNNFIPGIDLVDSINEFQNFSWKKEIIATVEQLASELQITKNVYGVTARATDFNNLIEEYITPIRDIIKQNPDSRFFLTSDSKEWEEQICNTFPNNVFKRKKIFYVKKRDENNASWSNNILRGRESVIEAVIDMHLLSKTNFILYNSASSFAQMITYLNR